MCYGAKKSGIYHPRRSAKMHLGICDDIRSRSEREYFQAQLNRRFMPISKAIIEMPPIALPM